MSFQTVTMTLLDGFLLNIELFAVTLVLSLPLGLVVSFRHHEPLQAPEPSGAPVCLHHALHPTDAPTGGGVLSARHRLWAWTLPGADGGGRPGLCAQLRAYFSEIFRGGIQGVPAGQREAGQVLGMTRSQIFFQVTLLQVVKRIVPPMGNEIITLVKDTSLSNFIMVGRSSSWPRTSATRA